MNGEDELETVISEPAVGERLRIAREAQGMTIEEIAAKTRIPARHLRTIERGSYDELPAATYTIGFIKSWARLLGLDGQALAQEFRTEMGGRPAENVQPLPYEPADPRRTPPLGLAILALLVAVALGLGYLYYRGTAEEATVIAAASTDQPATAAPAPRPAAPADAAAAPPASPSGGPVVIGATQDVWIKVSDGGKTLFLGVLKPGDRFEVPADAVAPLLTTGRPGNTGIMVGTASIPPVGDPDRAAKDVSLKPADLLARLAPQATQAAGNAAAPVENAAAPL